MINSDELLFVVDENNKPLKPLPRQIVHSQGIWHRTAHVWIFNRKKQILCQRRSLLKDSAPGKWEAFFGGHLGPNQEYVDIAQSELEEELGICTGKNDLKLFQIFKSINACEFEAIFGYLWNGNISDLILEKEEVDEVAWRDQKELLEIYKINNPAWTKLGYEEKALNWIVKL